MYSRFCPTRRPMNAVSGITRTVATTNAVEIQAISSSVAPTEPRMCVSATLTIEASIAPIRVPKLTETVTSHLLTGFARSRAPMSARDPGRATELIARRPPAGSTRRRARRALRP